MVPDHINESIEAILSVHQRAEGQITRHQRGIERLTNSLGRPSFLYLIVALVCGWVALNLTLPSLSLAPFDPPPFSFLQGLVTLSALMIAAMVLITQNHQMKLAEKRSHLDLQVNLLAERKIAKVVALLEELRRDLPNVRDRSDPEAKAMETRTDPQVVANAIEQAIHAEVQAEENGPRAPRR